MSLAMSIVDAKREQRRWWVLAIVVAAQFMFVADAFIVNVAIPSIRADLGATAAATAHAGSGGGVLSTVQQVGNASGVAVIGALFYAVQAADSARYAFVACLSTLAVAIAVAGGFLRVLGPHPSSRAKRSDPD